MLQNLGGKVFPPLPKSFDPDLGYRILALCQGHVVQFYQTFGDRNGEWLMLSYDPMNEVYNIWRDFFGSQSCSDRIQLMKQQSNGGPISLEQAQEAARQMEFTIFAKVPLDTMLNAAVDDGISTFFPANHRFFWSKIPMEKTWGELTVRIKLENDLPMLPTDVMRVDNQEIRREVLKRVGIENLKRHYNGKVIHSDDYGTLVHLPAQIEGITRNNREPLALVHVKCASTDREYLLQVPPDITEARVAVAWTFGFRGKDADLYHPTIET